MTLPSSPHPSPRRQETPIFARRRQSLLGARKEAVKPGLGRVKLVSDILAAWVGVLALVAGGLFGIHEYMDKQESDRVKETLNFLDRYHKEPFLDARMRLYKTWDRYSEAESNFRLTDRFDDLAFSAFIVKTVKDEDLASSIDLVTDFYSALDVCISAKACDEDLALLLFQADASAHFNRHFPYFDWSRHDQNDETVGKRLQEFKRRKFAG